MNLLNEQVVSQGGRVSQKMSGRSPDCQKLHILHYKIANTLSISSSKVPYVILKNVENLEKSLCPRGPVENQYLMPIQTFKNHCITNTPDTWKYQQLCPHRFLLFIEMEFDSSSSVVSYNPEHLPPENSSFLERSFVCRFRCLLDNSSGFLVRDILYFYQS